MALQDLTPQLRTRMSRVERVVGMFVFLAALLMLVAFGYYLYQTGTNRGWFINKVPYYCYAADATGIKVGDPVRMLGREVGRIVKVDGCPSDSWFVDNNYNVFIKFEVWEPYFGYIWTDSKVKLLPSDFFGTRTLEVTRGKDGAYVTVVYAVGKFSEAKVIHDKFPKNGDPTNHVLLSKVANGVWLDCEEAPSMATRVDQLVGEFTRQLPLVMTQVVETLSVATTTTSNANLAIQGLQPSIAQLATLSVRLNHEQGAVGRLLLTTNLEQQVSVTLGSMDATLTNTTALIRASEQQLQDLTRRIALTLDNVALVTSNLSSQVNANSLMLGEVSSLVVNADDMVQGLKRHWLLRGAFAGATNPPIEPKVEPRLDLSPR